MTNTVIKEGMGNGYSSECLYGEDNFDKFCTACFEKVIENISTYYSH